ncbi:MAG: hypothetical protein KKA42_09130, partial [candidate division Zixibacteria bacterium]|nr:hypothetical protein [candidate division Zixibacteria bacterium]
MLTQWLQSHPLIKGLVDVVYPPLCSGCGVFCDLPSAICTTCEQKVERYRHALCLGCEHFI